MAFNIDILENSGNPGDAQLADLLKMRIEAYGDEPLPVQRPEDKVEDENSSQPESITAEKQQVTIGLGYFAIADSLDTYVDPLVTIDDIERLSTIGAQIQDIIQPVLIGAQLKVPNPAQNERNWRRKVKKEIGYQIWHYRDVVDNARTYYDFEVAYQKAESENTMKTFSMEFGGKDNTEYGSERQGKNTNRLYVVFDKNSIRHIICDGEAFAPQNPSVSWDVDIAGGTHEDETSKVFHYNEIQPYTDSRRMHIIHIDPNNVQIKTTIPVWRGDTGKVITRTYDPSSNTFLSEMSIRNGQKIAGEPMQAEHVLAFIRSIVNIVPMRNY